MWQRIYHLVIKEILAVWIDKKSRFVLIFPPLLQLFIFSFAATLDVTNVHMGIWNRDNGEQSFELEERFYGSKIFSKITHLHSIDEVRFYINNQEGVAVVSIDEQFSRLLDSDKTANIQVILDGRKSNTSQIVAGYISNLIQQFNNDYLKPKEAEKQPAMLVPRNWFNPNLLYLWFTVPNLSGILTMLIALIVTCLSIAREREMGTFDQLLVSPLQPLEILAGKAIPAIIIGMLEGTIIIAAAILIFGIPFVGSFFYLYLGMFVFVCSIVGIGLFISALSATQQQAILGAFLFNSPAILLSGYATPIENMPVWLQYMTYANPLRFYLVIAKGEFLKSMPFSVLLENMLPMIITAIFTLSVSTWFFRRRLE